MCFPAVISTHPSGLWTSTENPLERFSNQNFLKMKISNSKLVEISRVNLGSEVVEPIYNTEQLLELLQVSRKTLQGWRDKGLIEFSAVNGKFYYRHGSVMKMLDNHSIKPF